MHPDHPQQEQPLCRKSSQKVTFRNRAHPATEPKNTWEQLNSLLDNSKESKPNVKHSKQTHEGEKDPDSTYGDPTATQCLSKRCKTGSFSKVQKLPHRC